MLPQPTHPRPWHYTVSQWHVVLDYETDAEIVATRNIGKAATALVPGCVFGSAASPSEAKAIAARRAECWRKARAG